MATTAEKSIKRSQSASAVPTIGKVHQSVYEAHSGLRNPCRTRRRQCPPPCSICGISVAHMKIHLIEHTQDENGLYHCTLCGKVDPLLGGMARHAEDHVKYEREMAKKAAPPARVVQRKPSPPRPTKQPVAAPKTMGPRTASEPKRVTLPSIRSFDWYHDFLPPAPNLNSKDTFYNAPLPPIVPRGSQL